METQPTGKIQYRDPESLEKALSEGVLESEDIDTLKRLLRETHRWRGYPQLPSVQQTLRHLIALKEASADQKKTLCWAKVGGVAGTVAAIAAVIAVCPKYSYDLSKSDTQLQESQSSTKPQSNAASILTNAMPAPTNQSTLMPTNQPPTR